MSWPLIGYMPKRRATRAHWASPYPEYPDAEFPVPPPIEEICSVSGCIAKAPALDMDGNPIIEMFCYPSTASARLAVATAEKQRFDLFAYRLAPVRFADGQAMVLTIPPLEVETMPASFERLGYDAVELSDDWSFGCSPLSCNGQTDAALVNRYCLVATEKEGLALACAFSLAKPEPGPFCAVEVWREAR